MEVLYPRCAGVDVHAGSVTACVRIASGADVTYQHRTVSATTQRVAGAGGLVGGRAVHARGDGSDGRVLEAGLARARGAVRARPGQRAAHSQRAGSQERHERCDVDRGSAGPRLDPRQLRAAGADPGTARPHAHAQTARPRDRPAYAAHPKDAGGCQYEADPGRQRHPGRRAGERF